MESLRLEGIEFSWPDSPPLICGADLKVQQGEIILIAGPSGHGKSTLLRIIGGLEMPSTGQLYYQGRAADMEEHSGLEVSKQKVGFVFQNCALISNLTVFDNVALPLRYHMVDDEEEIEKRVKMVLASMMALRYKDDFPFKLSMGMQKRVAVARSVIMDPSILLMDEPTAGLDNVNRRGLLALIANVRQLRHTTIVMVTHDLLIAKELGAKISVLNDGKLTEPATFEELQRSKLDFVEDLFKEMNAYIPQSGVMEEIE